MSSPEGPLRDIFEESHRVLAAAENEGLTVRLLGGLAVREHASDGRLPLARECKDIDLVTIKKHSRELAALLERLGYNADARFNALHAHRRQLFYDREHERQLDVFVGGFEMCHSLPIADRLHIHPRAIPLAELLLTKLQVVDLNAKDEHDIVSILVSHEINEEDEGSTIGASRVAQLCASDWGLWRTTKQNVARVREDLPEVPLSSEQRERALARLQELWSRIDAEPKSRRWKLRDRVGDKVRWYEEPEEVG